MRIIIIIIIIRSLRVSSAFLMMMIMMTIILLKNLIHILFENFSSNIKKWRKFCIYISMLSLLFIRSLYLYQHRIRNRKSYLLKKSTTSEVEWSEVSFINSDVVRLACQKQKIFFSRNHSYLSFILSCKLIWACARSGPRRYPIDRGMGWITTETRSVS